MKKQDYKIVEYETSYASLVLSYKLVMNLGLSLLGISAPKTM
ncbi:hypothetical protein NW072_05930 [Mycoplasmopsis felis]|nr:hypothetical protein [Mycoplasmopsis felis]UWV79520.1 hypothetical protein NW072_05930 [Mycoplasmopsis felis]